MTTTTPKTFLTIAQTAQLTGLSKYFLRGLKKQGRLPCVMCGNRAMINVDELLRTLREQQSSEKRA